MKNTTSIRVFVYNIQVKLSRSEARGLLRSGETLPGSVEFTTELSEHFNLSDAALTVVVEQHICKTIDREVLDFDMEIFRE